MSSSACNGRAHASTGFYEEARVVTDVNHILQGNHVDIKGSGIWSICLTHLSPSQLDLNSRGKSRGSVMTAFRLLFKKTVKEEREI